jgi:Type IV secretion-system coupling protein DNA-binding domain
MNTIFVYENLSDVHRLAEMIIPTPPGGQNAVWQSSAREVLVGIYLACVHNDTKTDGAFWKALLLSVKDTKTFLTDVSGAEKALGHLNQSDAMANSLLSVIHKSCSQFFSQQHYAKSFQP